MKLKNILVIGILLIILQVGFIFGQDIFLPGQEIPETESLEILSQGDVKWEVSENGKEATIFFTEKDILDQETFVEIEGNKYGNILSADKSLHPSYIKIDNLGKILEADLTANEKGGTYVINGVNFKLPANSRVYYKDGVLNLPKNSKVMNFDLSYQVPKVKGAEINLFDETSLNGEASFQREGYLIEKGEANYKRLKLKIDKNSGNILIANSKTDLSDYKGNWINQIANKLEIKSSETGTIDFEFLENNEILNIAKYGKLNAKITSGDGLVFEKRASNLPSGVTYKSSENGETFISNGDKIIRLNKNEIYATKEKNGAGYVEMEIKSDSKDINPILKINNKGELLTGTEGKLIPSMVGDRLIWKKEEYTPKPMVNYLGIKGGEIISITPLQEDEFYKFIPPGINRPQVYTIEDLPASAKIVSFLTPNLQRGLDILNEMDYQYNHREEGKMSPEEVEFKERIARTMIPAGYGTGLEKVEQILEGKEIQEFTSTLPGKVRTDLFRIYLGLPQQFETVKFTGREVVPTKEKNPTTQYYGFDAKQIIKQIKELYPEHSTFNELENDVNKGGKIPGSYTSQLLKYKAHVGFDKERNERYISYYDIWDLDPPYLKGMGIDVDKYNFPPEIYGRIYESDFEEVEQK